MDDLAPEMFSKKLRWSSPPFFSAMNHAIHFEKKKNYIESRMDVHQIANFSKL